MKTLKKFLSIFGWVGFISLILYQVLKKDDYTPNFFTFLEKQSFELNNIAVTEMKDKSYRIDTLAFNIINTLDSATYLIEKKHNIEYEGSIDVKMDSKLSYEYFYKSGLGSRLKHMLSEYHESLNNYGFRKYSFERLFFVDYQSLELGISWERSFSEHLPLSVLLSNLEQLKTKVLLYNYIAKSRN